VEEMGLRDPLLFEVAGFFFINRPTPISKSLMGMMDLHGEWLNLSTNLSVAVHWRSNYKFSLRFLASIIIDL
jgi:hypothetical protein